MFESLRKPERKIDKKLSEISEKGIVLNFSKLNEKIKECKSSDNHQCREQLKELGISWAEE